MISQNLSTVATDLIESYGNTAKNVIQAYRAGGERMVDFFAQRWEQALEQSSSQLTADVRDNASNAQKVFSGYYTKGLAFTTDGVETLVNKAVEFAGNGVQQVAANAGKFEEKTGTTALTQIAQASVPAVLAVSKLATQIEEKSAELAEKVAGDKAAAKPVSTAKKARARKAA